MTFLKKLGLDASGNAIAIGAALVVPVVALVGASLDMSVAYTTQAKLQNACDAAVLAGRQSMDGGQFKNRDETEAENYFEFNFPDGTHGAEDVSFVIEQNADDELELLGTATANQPTAMMRLFGYDEIPVSVSCNARRDQFDNDIVLVLDVTGSMALVPSGGGADTKIELLREGAKSLYRALEDDALGTTRYGFVPYSHTVNVGNALQNRDILADQMYVDNDGNNKEVHINESQWNVGTGGGTAGNTQNFRTSGIGCIEERPSVGADRDPAKYFDTITLADVDNTPQNANDEENQFGRYDPKAHDNLSEWTSAGGIQFYYIHDRWVQTGCPSDAKKLDEYDTEDDFNAAVDAVTANVTGGTYHDIGLLWGLRFVSRNGFFASDNPEDRAGVTINQHIIFMTDGKLDTGESLYSAFGIEGIQDRVTDTDLDEFHITRFETACNVAKAMGVTVWVIALDVTDTDDIRPCATSDEYFFTSDGSDLADVFASIGNGIGYLRLTS